GAALDKAATYQFDVIAIRDELVDLKGSLVVRTIQSTQSDNIGVIYSTVGDEGMMEGYALGQCGEAIRPLGGPASLAKIMHERVQNLEASKRERQVMQVFRSRHGSFLRRYADLKLRIDRISESRQS